MPVYQWQRNMGGAPATDPGGMSRGGSARPGMQTGSPGGGMNWGMTGGGTLAPRSAGSLGAEFDMQNRQAFANLQRAQAQCAAGDGRACQLAQQLQQQMQMQQGQQAGQLQGMFGRGQGGTMGAGRGGYAPGGAGRMDPGRTYAQNIIGGIFGMGGGGGFGGMG